MAENGSSKKWTRREKRPITAREAAERFGISVRTVQRAWAQPRDQYLAEALTRTRPWEKLGISRATWYRRGKPIPEDAGKGESNGPADHK